MQTQNIISTPEITGNIGSCTTQSIVVDTGRPSIWKTETKTLATNSCTGEIKEFNSWVFSGFLYFIVLAVLVLIWAIACIFND